MIQIVYACNDACFEGLYLSMLTILRRTKETINFNVLTADLSEQKDVFLSLNKKHQDILENLIKSFNTNNELKVIDCKNIYKQTLKKYNYETKKFWHTPYVIFRLFIDQFTNMQGKILYLDVDTMCANDINELYQFNIDNYEVGVVHDLFHKTRLHKQYFNAGVMLLNMDKIRKTHLFEKALNYLFTKLPRYQDQDALNMCVESRFFFPNEYRFNYQNRGIKKDTVIRHFVWAPFTFMTKPWHEMRVKKLLGIKCFNEDYALWNKAKLDWSK